MKRNEYLEQLSSALSFLPEESRRAALAFYAEMLDDRIEDGLDEESAAAAMEAPADIAARLRTENVEEIIAASPPTLGIRDEALEFASLASSALKGIETAVNAPRERKPFTAADAAKYWEEQERKAEEARAEKAAKAEEKAVKAEEKAAKAEEKAEEKADVPQPDGKKAPWEDAVSSALDAVGQALEQTGKTVGDLFADQGSKSKPLGDYEKKVFTCPADRVQAVSLMVSNMPLSIHAAEGDEITLVYYVSEWEPYRAELQDGTLTLWKEDKDWRGHFGLHFLINGFQLLWNQKMPTVELSVPPRALLDLTAHTANSSIRLEDLRALYKAELKTSNSRISVKNTACMILKAQTNNSRLVLEDVEAKKELGGKTSNARIAADSVICGGDLTLSTSNGRIEAQDVRAAGALSLTTSNGGIQASVSAAAQVTLRTSNAGIAGTLPGRMADWSISSGTSNGKNSLPRQQAGRKPLSVHTSNASIQVRFEQD